MRPCQHGRASTACPECAAIHLGITPSKDELKPRQWAEGEEAEWIADKVCILGDYGKDAARVLRRQVSELTALREKCAELQHKYDGVCLKWHDAVDARNELQRQLDEAAKQEPVCYANLWEWSQPDGSIQTEMSLEYVEKTPPGHCTRYRQVPLYRLPPNLPALIEQAKAEERELCLQAIPAKRFYVQGDSSSISLIKNGWNDACDSMLEAIRARKP